MFDTSVPTQAIRFTLARRRLLPAGPRSCAPFISSVRAFVVLVAMASGASAAGAAAPKADPADPLHAWVAGDDPAALESWVDAHLAAARRQVDTLLAAKGARTIANTLRPYDEAQNELAIASDQAGVLFAVGATAALRDKAQAMNEKISSAATDLNLNQPVYRALAAVALPDKDAATRHYLERTLLEYRLAGVDKDEATRSHIHQLQDRITALSLKFNRTVQDSVLKVSASRAELDGLPDDYIARLKTDADGRYLITTNEPDALPVLNFAANADLRRRVYLAYFDRAYPDNRQVLLDLLAARYELATLLGFANFAELATADQMIGSAAKVRQLFEQVDAASRETMNREFQELLELARGRQPGLAAISEADGFYWEEQYRRAHYSFDAQSVRPYFQYERVEQGIIGAAARIFGVRFRPVQGIRLWHPSVKVFDVIDQGRRVGRVYLDMHPREGKDKWFSSAPLLPGIRGRQMPEGMLICNFSGGVAGDPGLMEFDEVVTFFHEFGHLMHHILGSQHRYAGEGSFNVEGDFIEAPSQFLEEFFTSRNMLAPFARHYQTGEVIPEALVKRMNQANAFGRGRFVLRQLYYGSLSFELHDRPPAQIDPDDLMRSLRTRYSPYTWVEGNHQYASFTHLTGYASNYYTYLLDKLIALDFYSRFDRDQPLDGPMAARYRRSVIDPGASKPAAELVSDFLGRPMSMQAYKAWLSEEFRQ